MKKQILKIISDIGFTIEYYKTYRSDFGCQVYEVHINTGSLIKVFSDSYYTHENGAKEKMLDRLISELQN